jgi:hypothetical protein
MTRWQNEPPGTYTVSAADQCANVRAACGVYTPDGFRPDGTPLPPKPPRAEVREYPGANILVLDGQEIARIDQTHIWTRCNLLLTAAEWMACGAAIAAWQGRQA